MRKTNPALLVPLGHSEGRRDGGPRVGAAEADAAL